MAQIPEVTPSSNKDDNPYSGYTVHYKKMDMDFPEELENLESAALTGEGNIVILSLDKFYFKDQAFILVKYLQK